MESIKKIIEKANYYIGYLEKKSNSELDSFTANAGSNNYTRFARDYYKHTGSNYQGQAWCAMFISDIFVQCFGLTPAISLLGQMFSYTPYGVNKFKEIGRWHTDNPQEGDVIFFTNGSRAYHVGLVYAVDSSKVYTIEGNTSGASGVIENGGGVCKKSYSLSYYKIMGYGRPNYSLVEVEEKKSGWVEEDGLTRYYLGDTGNFVTNDWYKVDDDWYWFDGNGDMISENWYKDGEYWYWFDSTGKMVSSKIVIIQDKPYYFNDDGIMEQNATLEFKADEDGVLKFFGRI